MVAVRYVNRRDFLRVAGLSAAASLLAACAPTGQQAPAPAPAKPTEAPKAAAPTAATEAKPAQAPAQAKDAGPVKVGAMWIMSGALSAYGQFAKEGLELAVEELNTTRGGILGRRIEHKIEDEGNADNAVRVARRLALEENVDVLMGLDSSGVGEAVTPTMKELRKILMVTHAASPKVTGELCNPYVFRISVNVPQNSAAGAQVAKELPVKRWTTIGPDYAFGHQSWEYFKSSLQKLNPDVEFVDDRAQWPKLGNEDFSSFSTALVSSGVEGIWSSTWGNDLINLVRQGTQYGLFRSGQTLLFELGAAMEVLEALNEQMPTGLWVGTRYWFQEPKTDRNQKFVEAFFRKYNHYPSYNAQTAYSGLHTVAAAAEKAGSIEAEKLIPVLENFEVELPQGNIRIRKEDHQALVQGVWGQTSESREYKFRVLEPLRTFRPEDITPTPEEAGCRL